LQFVPTQELSPFHRLCGSSLNASFFPGSIHPTLLFRFSRCISSFSSFVWSAHSFPSMKVFFLFNASSLVRASFSLSPLKLQFFHTLGISPTLSSICGTPPTVPFLILGFLTRLANPPHPHHPWPYSRDFKAIALSPLVVLISILILMNACCLK